MKRYFSAPLRPVINNNYIPLSFLETSIYTLYFSPTGSTYLHQRVNVLYWYNYSEPITSPMIILISSWNESV